MANIVFLQRLYCEYGGPTIISAVLKNAGHKVSVFIGEKSTFFLHRIKNKDIVAFSVMSGLHNWAITIASEIKRKRDVLTVFGGPHPTYFPEIINHHAVDVVCLGEGEYPMLDLANALDRNLDISKIPNLWVKKYGTIYKNEIRPLIDNLDTLPFPDRDLYYSTYPYLKNDLLKTFKVARGCPYRCSFCFNPTLQDMYRGKGKYTRFRSPQNIIREINEVRDKYGLKKVLFYDDVFILNKEWLRDFLCLYKKEILIPFSCDARIDTLDEEIIIMLKEAGCFCLRFGIESGNEKIRNGILKKEISDDNIINIVRVLKKHKLKFLTYNMVGIPEETLDDIYQTIDLNVKIRTDYPRCSLLTPYPGTEIARYAAEKGMLEVSTDKIFASFQQYQSIIKSDHKNEIINLHLFFQTAVIFPRTRGLINKLIFIPTNILFRIWWAIVYFFIYMKSEGRRFWHTFVFALRISNALFEK